MVGLVHWQSYDVEIILPRTTHTIDATNEFFFKKKKKNGIQREHEVKQHRCVVVR